jgi:dihydroflavonol-4-reductase
MAPVSPASGPIAVTGASGYIGSHITRDLMEAGYTVRACVRDRSQPRKVEHLLAMNADKSLRGRVELWEADLAKPGSYDAPFAGAAAVIHAGAAVGFNGESPQEVYDGCFVEVKHVLDSALKGGAKRFVFTSSFAAVVHPRPPGYVFTERDWCGDNAAAYKGRWDDGNIPKIRAIAYAKAKASIA